jgi:hypothetical protein
VTNAYFVVEPEEIVAQDLAHAIRAHDPLAEVCLFRSTDEAASALAHHRPLVVILHAESGRFMASQAAHVLTGAGVPLAFLGEATEAWPEGAEVLASPFSESTVAALMQRLEGLSSMSGGEG